jgi:choline dehydrogenase-like flavoprotein
VLIDFGRLDASRVFDTCVIGSGPAGLTVAMKLASEGRAVLLVEGGGFEFDDASQDAYDGKVVGDPGFDLRTSRLRQFGGTSGHWGGWCRNLDEIDFEFKQAIPLARWPIRKTDLDPYLDQASAILEIDRIPRDRVIVGAGIKEIAFVYSPPVRFADKYKQTVLESDGILLCLNATVTSLAPGGGAISGATVQSIDGRKARVRARRYVLATGGIENSRLLLWSNVLSSGTVVKSAATLGRYWMEHPHFTIGSVLVYGKDLNKGFFSLTPDRQRELKVLNCGLRLEPEAYEGTKQLVADLLCVAPDLGEWVLKQFDKRLICGARLRAAWEQEPRPDNRVELSKDSFDRFGVPRATLHWSKSARDLDTIRKTALHFGSHLVAFDLGRVKLHDWVLGKADYPTEDELVGFHHMGGTRMAATPEEGIVDANLKVWGQQNLYVCGSSVFPSTGHANPTLTIVQLALRLADHLRKA